MPNAAEIFVDTRVAWDVEVMLGLAGDGINGIMEALRKTGTKSPLSRCAMKNLPH